MRLTRGAFLFSSFFQGNFIARSSHFAVYFLKLYRRMLSSSALLQKNASKHTKNQTKWRIL